VKDELGLHARPAGMLVKLVQTLGDEVRIQKGERRVEGTRLLALMGLGIRCGDTVTVEIEGANEETSEKALRAFFEKNL
jgi:phosphocarrier protein